MSDKTQADVALAFAIEALEIAFGSQRSQAGFNTIFVQPSFFIDSIAGNDNLPGISPATAIRTWAEFQRRIGKFTEVSVLGGPGILTINLLNNLPVTDPITWFNALAPGNTALIQGQTVVLSSGVLTATQTDDPVANVPGTVTAPGLGQAQVGKQIQITAGTGIGSRAGVGFDFGGGQVQVTEWVTGNSTVGDAFSGIVYGPLPAPGDGYQIVDFTTAFLGVAFVTYDSSDAAGIGTGGLAFQNIHFPITPDGPAATTIPGSLTQDTFVDFADCIFDQFIQIGSTNAFNAYVSCIIRSSNVTAQGGSNSLFVFGGAIPLTVAEGGSGDIFFVFQTGSSYNFDGNYACIGSGIPVPGVGPGVHMLAAGVGNISAPISFWRVDSPMTFQQNIATFFGSGGFFGLSPEPPIYGDFNALPFGLEGGIMNLQTGIGGSNVLPILPTIQFPLIVGFPVNPPLTADIAWLFDGATTQTAGPLTSDTGSLGLPFDPHTATYVAPLRKNTWANLAIPIGGGGYMGDVTPGIFSGHHSVSSSQRPENAVGPQSVVTAILNTT